ncbi:MAG: indole-3-glycerol phosphate synthase TrpC [Blastocatellia bacterium]
MTTPRPTLPGGVLAAGGILDRIVAAKVARLEIAKRSTPFDLISQSRSPRPNSLIAALGRTERVNIIAEIKQRSPSKGIICDNFDPRRIAKGYAESGAAALSVLAEEDFFGGSLEHIVEIRSRVELPVLRKDFLFDEYQLYESVFAGADAVLLIVAILDDLLLSRLIGLAGELGLDALVEVHTADEMKRAVQAGARIIGVNNRDLITFRVDLATSIELADLAPSDAILVSESGINTGIDIKRLKSAGFSAFLVGEHLMRAKNPGAAIEQLMTEAEE